MAMRHRWEHEAGSGLYVHISRWRRRCTTCGCLERYQEKRPHVWKRRFFVGVAEKPLGEKVPPCPTEF